MTEHTRCDGTPECPSESHAQSCWKWRPMTEFQKGTSERALADHLDAEGFGGWVNCDEIVEDVKRFGWVAKGPQGGLSVSRYALRLNESDHPNDRMFFDTVKDVVGAVQWALESPYPHTELVITVDESQGSERAE